MSKDDSGNPLVYNSADDVNEQANAARERMGEGTLLAMAQIDAQAAVLAAAALNGKRAFICPTTPNYSKLVQVGKVTPCYAGTSTPVVAGVTSQGGVDMVRLGDVKIQFTGGIAIVDPSDEEGAIVCAWADAHPEVCRDVFDPTSETWSAMKKSQLNLKNQEPSLSPSMDIDRVLRGDFSQFGEHASLVGQARRMLEAQAVSV